MNYDTSIVMEALVVFGAILIGMSLKEGTKVLTN
jgi:hypothetical protein